KRLIKDRLVAALDFWGDMRRRTPKNPGARCQRLFQIARLVDPDPWRNRIRDAMGQLDVKANAKARLKLAAPDKVSALPPSTLVFLGRVLTTVGEFPAAEKVLRQARRQHPADYWVNLHLAFCCESIQPPKTDEAIRFYTAAVALRSQSAAAR